jgi:hypothetical protein
MLCGAIPIAFAAQRNKSDSGFQLTAACGFAMPALVGIDEEIPDQRHAKLLNG